MSFLCNGNPGQTGYRVRGISRSEQNAVGVFDFQIPIVANLFNLTAYEERTFCALPLILSASGLLFGLGFRYKSKFETHVFDDCVAVGFPLRGPASPVWSHLT